MEAHTGSWDNRRMERSQALASLSAYRIERGRGEGKRNWNWKRLDCCGVVGLDDDWTGLDWTVWTDSLGALAVRPIILGWQGRGRGELR